MLVIQKQPVSHPSPKRDEKREVVKEGQTRGEGESPVLHLINEAEKAELRSLCKVVVTE